MNDLVGLGKALEPFSQGTVGLLRRLFGPAASEIGETFADKVRSYRRKNLTTVLEKAEKKIGESDLEELPLRFSIPFAEKASLIEEDSLAEKWANLLASAATNFSDEHVSFINILARLSPSEAKLLDRLVPPELTSDGSGELPDHVVFKRQNDGAKDVIPGFAGIISKVSFSNGELSEEGRRIADFFVNRDLGNIIIEMMQAQPLDVEDHSGWIVFNKSVSDLLVSIDLLQAEGLVERSELYRTTSEVSVSASVISATALGWMFASSCRSKKEQ
ncbi:MAG: Abi-alpha family protein [Pseudomonadota bacterium]